MTAQALGRTLGSVGTAPATRIASGAVGAVANARPVPAAADRLAVMSDQLLARRRARRSGRRGLRSDRPRGRARGADHLQPAARREARRADRRRRRDPGPVARGRGPRAGRPRTRAGRRAVRPRRELPRATERVAVVALGDAAAAGGPAPGWCASQSLPTVGWGAALAAGAVVTAQGNRVSDNRERADGGWVSGYELARAAQVATVFTDPVSAVAIVIDDYLGSDAAGQVSMRLLDAARVARRVRRAAPARGARRRRTDDPDLRARAEPDAAARPGPASWSTGAARAISAVSSARPPASTISPPCSPAAASRRWSASRWSAARASGRSSFELGDGPIADLEPRCVPRRRRRRITKPPRRTRQERPQSMTAPGFFELYSAARPALPAGAYTASSSQDAHRRHAARRRPADPGRRHGLPSAHRRPALRDAARPDPVDLPAGRARRATGASACRRSSSSGARCRGSATRRNPQVARPTRAAVARARRPRRGRGPALDRRRPVAVRHQRRRSRPRTPTCPRASTSRSPRTSSRRSSPARTSWTCCATCARSTSTTPSSRSATTTDTWRSCWPTGCRSRPRPKQGESEATPLKYTAYLINLEHQIDKLLATEPAPSPFFNALEATVLVDAELIAPRPRRRSTRSRCSSVPGRRSRTLEGPGAPVRPPGRRSVRRRGGQLPGRAGPRARVVGVGHRSRGQVRDHGRRPRRWPATTSTASTTASCRSFSPTVPLPGPRLVGLRVHRRRRLRATDERARGRPARHPRRGPAAAGARGRGDRAPGA